jgi:hypothetical protein
MMIITTITEMMIEAMIGTITITKEMNTRLMKTKEKKTTTKKTLINPQKNRRVSITQKSLKNMSFIMKTIRKTLKTLNLIKSLNKLKPK